MRKVTIFVSFIFLFCNAMASFADPYQEKARLICEELFNGRSIEYGRHFSSLFLKAVAEEDLYKIVSEVMDVAGNCTKAILVDDAPDRKIVQLITTTLSQITISFSLDSANLMNYFLIRDVDVAGDKLSWETLVATLDALPVFTAMSIVKFDGSKKELRAHELNPLASGFKLYVLAAVNDAISRGERSWHDQFPITAHYKSLPSGKMHELEDGLMVSLYDFAEKMIENSDNTATDHLIHLIGRSAVEAQLVQLDNSFAWKNIPFLTTAEMFKLKWAAPLSMTNEFIHATAETRRMFVEGWLKNLALHDVGTNGMSMRMPTSVRDLEWFGSTDDLCEAMHALKEAGSEEVLRILSRNVPMVNVGENAHWQYAGYKGGSEPGVLTMTFLLQNQRGEWGCVAMAWHHEQENFNQWSFFERVKDLLSIAESEI